MYSISFKTLTMAFMVITSLQAVAASKSLKNTVSKSEQMRSSRETMAINLEPIYVLLGGVSARGEYFVNDKISAGIGGTIIPGRKMEATESTPSRPTNFNLEHSAFYAISNIMLTGSLSQDGFYLSPLVGYMKTAISNYGEFNLGGSLSSPYGKLTAGYQWITSTNFRIGLGAGATIISNSEVVVRDSGGKEVLRSKADSLSGSAIDFHLGLLF